jgi:hypothetical protein
MPGYNPRGIAELRKQRELVDGKWVSTHPNCKHGTASGATYYSCCCEKCRAAMNVYGKQSYERRQHNRLIIQKLTKPKYTGRAKDYVKPEE